MTQQKDYVTATDVISAQKEEPILKFFNYGHLTEGKLKDTSKMFNVLAVSIVETLPRNAERTVSLRKLLEAKDCAVRANL